MVRRPQGSPFNTELPGGFAKLALKIAQVAHLQQLGIASDCPFFGTSLLESAAYSHPDRFRWRAAPRPASFPTLLFRPGQRVGQRLGPAHVGPRHSKLLIPACCRGSHCALSSGCHRASAATLGILQEEPNASLPGRQVRDKRIRSHATRSSPLPIAKQVCVAGHDEAVANGTRIHELNPWSQRTAAAVADLPINGRCSCRIESRFERAGRTGSLTMERSHVYRAGWECIRIHFPAPQQSSCRCQASKKLQS